MPNIGIAGTGRAMTNPECHGFYPCYDLPQSARERGWDFMAGSFAEIASGLNAYWLR